jgi:hypothetical protein
MKFIIGRGGTLFDAVLEATAIVASRGKCNQRPMH